MPAKYMRDEDAAQLAAIAARHSITEADLLGALVWRHGERVAVEVAVARQQLQSAMRRSGGPGPEGTADVEQGRP